MSSSRERRFREEVEIESDLTCENEDTRGQKVNRNAKPICQLKRMVLPPERNSEFILA
jgi:hypothetical protein